MASLDDFINGLKDEAQLLGKKEFIEWIRGAKDEGDEFVKQQRLKLERYAEQLAKQEITASQFKQYILDLQMQVELEALMQSVATKARAQALVSKVEDLVLKRLVKLL